MAITDRARLVREDDYLTIPAAMRRLAIGRDRLMTLVATRVIASTQVAGQLFVERASLEAFRSGGGA